jgi:uncharacterized DUF497 family protein
MHPETTYDFEWDPVKTLYNARKHGVTFDQAATVFLDAFTLTVYDEANSQNEDRWFTLGYDASGRLLAVATPTTPLDRPMFGCASLRPARLRAANGDVMKRSRDR